MNGMDQDRFARQLPLFGKEGQAKIRAANVTFAGFGGLGSIIFPEVILLGVDKGAVIEPEDFDSTNRGRYMGFHYDDIGKKKCLVAKRIAQSIDSNCSFSFIEKKIETKEAFDAVKQSSVVIGGFDSDGPRAILNELCIAYDIPYIDVASEVFPDGTYGGRVAVVMNGNGCLNCMGCGLDQDEITEYLSGKEALENKAAIYGVDVEHLSEGFGPSVASINGVVASLGVTEFQALVTGIREPFRYLNYRGHLQSITKGETGKSNDCYFCSLHGKGEVANVERYLGL